MFEPDPPLGPDGKGERFFRALQLGCLVGMVFFIAMGVLIARLQGRF